MKRTTASGRPSGTDGSDYSYRMVVDPRYMKVAQGKSKLYGIILVQEITYPSNALAQAHLTLKFVWDPLQVLMRFEAVIQVIRVVWAFLSSSFGKNLDKTALLAIIVGLVSLIPGEIGRRRSQKNSLRIYIILSSIAITFSVAKVASSNFFSEVVRDPHGSKTQPYMVEAGCVLFSVPVQLFAIITTISLLQNMTPKRVA